MTGDEPASTGEVLGIVFPQSVAAWCGVVGGMVPSGQRQIPVLSVPERNASRRWPRAPCRHGGDRGLYGDDPDPKAGECGCPRYDSERTSATFDVHGRCAAGMNLREAISRQNGRRDSHPCDRAEGPAGRSGPIRRRTRPQSANMSHALTAIFGAVDGKYASAGQRNQATC